MSLIAELVAAHQESLVTTAKHTVLRSSMLSHTLGAQDVLIGMSPRERRRARVAHITRSILPLVAVCGALAFWPN